jgi:hypothetical protein
VKFLFDNNLSPHLSRGISALSGGADRHYIATHLREKFPDDTPDVLWLRQLQSEGGWVVIYGDQFKKSADEKLVIRGPGIKTIVLDPQWARHTFWDKAARMVLWWPKILAEVEKSSFTSARLPWKLTNQHSLASLRRP